jgi:hypothetical protein
VCQPCTEPTDTDSHQRMQAKRFFKIAEQGNDKSDADVTWYIEQKWVDVNVQDKVCSPAPWMYMVQT